MVSDFATSLAKANQELIRMFRELNLRDFYQTISQAEHVYIYSTGWQQQMIEQYLAHELFMVGKQAIVLPAAFDELRMSNVFAKSGDLLVIISFSGDDVKINTELTRLALVNDKFKYVALTNMKQNKLAYLADHPDFPNGELAFGPAYSLVDLLVSGYLDWLQKK
ncbi:MAG: SIS domain-containing protein [Lactobacillus sp.]